MELVLYGAPIAFGMVCSCSSGADESDRMIDGIMCVRWVHWQVWYVVIDGPEVVLNYRTMMESLLKHCPET